MYYLILVDDKRFTLLPSTLAKFPNSLLYETLVTKQLDEGCSENSLMLLQRSNDHSTFVVDTDPNSFEYIIAGLRGYPIPWATMSSSLRPKVQHDIERWNLWNNCQFTYDDNNSEEPSDKIKDSINNQIITTEQNYDEINLDVIPHTDEILVSVRSDELSSEDSDIFNLISKDSYDKNDLNSLMKDIGDELSKDEILWELGDSSTKIWGPSVFEINKFSTNPQLIDYIKLSQHTLENTNEYTECEDDLILSDFQ